MSDESRFVGSSIEELLVALAEGVREAQSALNQGPLTDASGRPMATYHLPYLDFTINVEIATLTSERGRPVALLFNKAAGGAGDDTSKQVRSSISGRLVAVPPGEGLPVPRIRLTSEAPSAGAVPIDLLVTNSAGERLAGQLVELNIDEAASRRLSLANGAASFIRASGTRLQDALVTTDAHGQAQALLRIGSGVAPKSLLSVTATIGATSTMLVIPLGPAT